MPTGATLGDHVQFVATRLGWGAVAVVGAGLSLPARYPLTATLPPLVWAALDADPGGRALLDPDGRAEGASAQELVGHDPGRLFVAWTVIAGRPAARAAFQTMFAALDAERASQPAPAFDALARLLHDRIVEHVVSLNWDTGVEAAYRRRYGTDIPAGLLSKPHGDAARPDLPWVLPNDPGRLDPESLSTLERLRQTHPRTLLVVGYSESDAHVVDALIAPLSSEWETVRISPNAAGPNNVPRGADEILPPVADRVCAAETRTAWQHVTFASQRDGLAAALRGARLGPGDVDSCPRLPEAQQVVDALQAADAVALVGASGGGKSITAYQALRDLNVAGFEIVRAGERLADLGPHDAVTQLLAAPWPTVAFVDDAQALDPDLLRRLGELATPQRKVLVVSTDPVPGPALAVTIAEKRAVQLLAQAILERSADVLPRVRQLDDTVGDGYLDQPLERRVEIAAAQDVPWQFVFVLTGGWRRARQTLGALRDADRADLALLAVSVLQLASADAGARLEDVEAAAAALGRDGAWLATALERLRAGRHVTGDARLRAAHAQMAISTLRALLHPPRTAMPPTDDPVVPPIAGTRSAPGTSASRPGQAPPPRPRVPTAEADADRAAVAALLGTALDSDATPLRGVYWLLDCLHGWEIGWALNRTGLLDSARVDRLARRALASAAAAGRGTAGYLLADLLQRDADTTSAALLDSENTLAAWVREAEPASAYGLARLFNSLGASMPDLARRIMDAADPRRLAQRLSTTAWADAEAWAKLVDRLAYAGGPNYAEQIADALDAGSLHALCRGVPPDRLYAFAELVKVVYFLKPELGTALVAAAAGHVASHLSARPAKASAELQEVLWWPLGHAPGFLRHRGPDPDQRRAARALARALDPDRVALAVARGNPRDWESVGELLLFVFEADPRAFIRIATAVDLPDLARHSAGQWAAPSRGLLQVLLLLRTVRADEIRALAEAHADEIEHLSPAVVGLAPKVAVAVLGRGVPLDLGFAHGGWDRAAAAVRALHDQDPGVAAAVLEANEASLRRGLALKATDTTGLAEALAAADDVAPGLVNRAVGALEADAVSGWRAHLSRRAVARHGVAELAQRTAASSGPAAGAAADLLKKYPSLSARRARNG